MTFYAHEIKIEIGFISNQYSTSIDYADPDFFDKVCKTLDGLKVIKSNT